MTEELVPGLSFVCMGVFCIIHMTKHSDPVFIACSSVYLFISLSLWLAVLRCMNVNDDFISIVIILVRLAQSR